MLAVPFLYVSVSILNVKLLTKTIDSQHLVLMYVHMYGCQKLSFGVKSVRVTLIITLVLC